MLIDRDDCAVQTMLQRASSARLTPVIVMRGSAIWLVGVLAFGLFVFGDAKAQVLNPPLAADQRQEMPAPKSKGDGPGLATSSATSADRVPSGNPLWTIPLASLTVTRERPVFSASRRPPPPVVVAKAAPPPPPPPKPAEPEKPQLSLVGTIVEESGEGIGLFTNPADRSALRLKTGENHKGWILREVRQRQVVLEKGQQIATLELPRHDLNKGGSAPPAVTTATLPATPPTPTDVAPAPTEVPMAALPAAPPASMDMPPANQGTEMVADGVAATASLLINTRKPTGGFRMPARMESQSTEGDPAVTQPPPTSFPEPSVNPFQSRL